MSECACPNYAYQHLFPSRHLSPLTHRSSTMSSKQVRVRRASSHVVLPQHRPGKGKKESMRKAVGPLLQSTVSQFSLLVIPSTCTHKKLSRGSDRWCVCVCVCVCRMTAVAFFCVCMVALLRCVLCFRFSSSDIRKSLEVEARKEKRNFTRRLPLFSAGALKHAKQRRRDSCSLVRVLKAHLSM